MQDEQQTLHPQFTIEKPLTPCYLATSDAFADCAAGKHRRIGIFCIGRVFHGTISLTSSILKEDGYGRSNETPVEWIPQWHGLDTLLL